MDTNKLKFDINIDYDCDEGMGCNKYLDNGTYEEAIKLFSSLEDLTYITGYYHTMTINVAIYDENENQLDLSEILDGDYEWLDDQYYTTDKIEATDLPGECLKFLKDLKKSHN
jgi:hypothetical protein